MANESVWFATLAGVALKSTIVLGAAWLMVVLLRGRSAAVRHLIWTAAAAAVLALPILSISLPALRVSTPAALDSSDAAVLFRSTAIAKPVADASAIPQRPTISRASAPWRPDWRLSLILLWAAGSIVGLLRIVAACAAMWRVRRAATPSRNVQLSTELSRDLGIGRPVDVLETAPESMPMTFGILRPAVFLPAGSAEWSEDRRRIVLLHELAHVRRGDVATHMLARLALILHWWNPLAWTAWRGFLKERERATDDLVLKAGALASDYAGHLLDVARSMRAVPVGGTVAVAMARPSELEGRLVAILDSRVNRTTAGRASAIVAVVAGISLVAPLAAVRAQEKPSPAISAELDAAIRAASAQKDYTMLEKPAEAFVKLGKYDEAKRLLESAAAIREEVSGSQSVEYGVGLMKIAELEKKRNHAGEAETFYTKALQVLGDRPESAAALMDLGMRSKDLAQAFDYFERAQRVDVSLAGPATTWMAVIREREQKPAEAEELYRSALTMVNPESADAANTMELFTRFLNEQKREDESKEMAERSAVLLKSLYRSEPLTSGRNYYRMGDGVRNPTLLSKVEPQYSAEARFAKYTGTVVCSVVVDPEGLPQNVRVVRGIGLGLDQRAVEAIAQWRFKPGSKDGAPVPVAANIEVNFRLF